MSDSGRWVSDETLVLLTDLYELTMLQAYWREGLSRTAVFSLFARRLPPGRNYLLACGLDDALHCLEHLVFDDAALDWLRHRPEFQPEFLDWLRGFRFRGDVYAVREGTPVFAEEPLLEVVASLPEAQLAETIVMNQVQCQTVMASKASRIVHAAAGRSVVDFGLRRMHGADAGLKAARAFHIAGVDATSNVLAGRVYGVPIAGTMAHSYIQVHDHEADAMRAFAALYPDSILLVDTYDTLEGVRRVIRLAGELGDGFRVRGVRLDSGDLGELAVAVRGLLDTAGLRQVEIFASGGLDEHAIAGLVARGAPIDGFGVGTDMAVSRDAPALDMAYKLTEYDGRGRLKLSPGKPILPGRKQLFRVAEGEESRDELGRAGETISGRPLLHRVMAGGRRMAEAQDSLDQARARRGTELSRLPARIRELAPAEPPYPVKCSDALRAYRDDVAREVAV
jgi:nicotinate phosphoribosyltransferase